MENKTNKLTLAEFIDTAYNEWDEIRRNRPASQVLLGKMPGFNWVSALKEAGYPSVTITYDVDLNSAREWVISKYGHKNLARTGNTFWFSNSQEALMFALKWGAKNINIQK